MNSPVSLVSSTILLMRTGKTSVIVKDAILNCSLPLTGGKEQNNGIIEKGIDPWLVSERTYRMM
jgi:hypothetical protein